LDYIIANPSTVDGIRLFQTSPNMAVTQQIILGSSWLGQKVQLKSERSFV